MSVVLRKDIYSYKFHGNILRGKKITFSRKQLPVSMAFVKVHSELFDFPMNTAIITRHLC